jgi:hypothetical protein
MTNEHRPDESTKTTWRKNSKKSALKESVHRRGKSEATHLR